MADVSQEAKDAKEREAIAYPYNPSNALQDGDGWPSDADLASKDLRRNEHGNAAVPIGGVDETPRPDSNLELEKALEKHAVARDQLAGLDDDAVKSQQEARANVRRQAAQARKFSGASRTDAPSGRTATPTKATASGKSATS